MQIVVDFSSLEPVLGMNPIELFWYLFSHGGWLILLILFLLVLYDNWISNRRQLYVKNTPQTLLAIDIPRDNEQSMIAVEQIFATLAGIRIYHLNLWEKYYLGKIQLYFSLEIVSLEGYIQFLIRTPVQFRDLVEAAVYAQYPDAEITEVDDYVNLIPEDVHEIKSDYNLWGTEFKLPKNSAYPIKTYRSFEHSLTGTFIDPMAALLEVMSKLGKGEQLAIQLVISPAGDDWKEYGYGLIKKLIGQKIETKKHLGDKLVDATMKTLDSFGEQLIPLWGDIKEKEKYDNKPYNLMQNLTPGERGVVEAIQNKLSQICFGVRFRIYYLAHNEIFLKGRGVSPIIGAIGQFNTTHLNAFWGHPPATTDANYFFIKHRISKRQKRLIKNFKNRMYYKGAASRKSPKIFYLSLEELATIYHFPTITVKAPLLKHAEEKKAEPPTSLPIRLSTQKEYFKYPAESLETEVMEEMPEIPTKETEDYLISESLPGYDFDNDYYEKMFAKNKKSIKNKIEQSKDQSRKAEPPTNLPIA